MLEVKAGVCVNASRLYLISQAITSLADSLIFTTYALYYVQGLGLSPLELVLVGTAVELAVLLFEIPTGAMADSHGRRRSVIIGTFVMAMAYLAEGGVPFWSRALPFFWAVALAEVVRGIGWTFISGAEEAWITDEVGADQVGALHLKTGQVNRIMGLVGIPLSVLLANVRLYLPYLTGGAIFVGLGLLLLLKMPETAFQPRPRAEGSHWQAFRETMAEGLAAVRGRPILLALLSVSAIAGAASEGVDRLWEAHFLTTFHLASVLVIKPATAFGILAALSAILSIGVAALGRRYLDLGRERAVTRTLLATAGMRVICLATFALAPNIAIAVAANLTFRLIGAIYDPAYRTWLNQKIDAPVRATVLSLMSQSDALGQSAGGPLVGWVGTRFSLRASLTLSALLLSPAVAVYGRVFGRSRQAESEPAVAG